MSEEGGRAAETGPGGLREGGPGPVAGQALEFSPGPPEPCWWGSGEAVMVVVTVMTRKMESTVSMDRGELAGRKLLLI